MNRPVTRPQNERFDMSFEESMAFWSLILREYPYRFIRERSILLSTNTSPYSFTNE